MIKISLQISPGFVSFDTVSRKSPGDLWALVVMLTVHKTLRHMSQERDRSGPQRDHDARIYCGGFCKSGGISQKFPDQKWELYVRYASQRNCGKKHILPWTSAYEQQRICKCWGRGWKLWHGYVCDSSQAVVVKASGCHIVLCEMKQFTVRRMKVTLASKFCFSNF